MQLRDPRGDRGRLLQRVRLSASRGAGVHPTHERDLRGRRVHSESPDRAASPLPSPLVRRSPPGHDGPRPPHRRTPLPQPLRELRRHPRQGPRALGTKSGLRRDDRQLRRQLPVPADERNRVRAVHRRHVRQGAPGDDSLSGVLGQEACSSGMGDSV